tara:strand:+ start:411 stop:1292 length:882 start_codon:yes stop_codon:yes gene_type:complete
MTNILQNQKKSNFLKPFKEQALKDIQISIEEWNEFQEKNFFYQIFSKQKRSNHWETSNFMLNLFHVHLRWSKRTIRSQTNIEKKEVLNVLIAMKNFYSKISVIKPDLSHPDIVECFNLSARESNLKQKKIKFKDSIEINFYDPFNNVIGKDTKNIEQKYNHEKKVALKYIENSLDYLDQIDDKLSRFDLSRLEKPKILTYTKINSRYELKFLWCDEELESYKNLKKKDVKKKLNQIKKKINYFNILRPNFSDSLTDKMYKCLLNNNVMNTSYIPEIKRKFDVIKKKFKKIVNI